MAKSDYKPERKHHKEPKATKGKATETNVEVGTFDENVMKIRAQVRNDINGIRSDREKNSNGR